MRRVSLRACAASNIEKHGGGVKDKVPGHGRSGGVLVSALYQKRYEKILLDMGSIKTYADVIIYNSKYHSIVDCHVAVPG
jgi:hypothetical protein